MNDLQKQVQQVLDGMVGSGAEDGLQTAVYRRGELLVDAAAGTAEPGADRPVTPDTLFYVASAGKGITATVVHVLVERGVFAYDTRLVELWPEFGAHGKESATVRHALSHTLGVPGVPADTTVDRLRDWDGMCATIADATPWWTPGERTGYHAITFGYVLGEIVRRATGKRISKVLAEEVAGPLGVADELFLGVPREQLPRMARFVDDPDGAAMFAMLPPDFPLFKAGPRELMPSAAWANDADLMRRDVPAMGTTTARAMARMYAALLDEVDGVRLVSPARLAELTTDVSTGNDEISGAPAHYGLGYTVGYIGQASAPSTVFGMVGIGGSACYADAATGVTVAVTKNHLNPVEMNAYERVHEVVTNALA